MKKLLTVLLVLCLCCASALAADLTLTTNGGVVVDLSALPHQDEAAPAVVYFISDISPESLVKAYQALGVQLPGKVGVKLSTGESERSNYLRPALNYKVVEFHAAVGRQICRQRGSAAQDKRQQSNQQFFHHVFILPQSPAFSPVMKYA